MPFARHKVNFVCCPHNIISSKLYMIAVGVLQVRIINCRFHYVKKIILILSVVKITSLLVLTIQDYTAGKKPCQPLFENNFIYAS